MSKVNRMNENNVSDITRDEIMACIGEYVAKNTGYPMGFNSLEQAIDASVNAIFIKANDFDVLTQEMVDTQAESHDGYLDGATVGDLVWGDNDMWVSQSTVESWYHRTLSETYGKDLSLREIESLVCDHLILMRLVSYNDGK